MGFIFGGPLILAALNFAINSFSYLGQGDIKGLFKYWGQNALQIAILAASFALMFIPGLGQALAAGLKFLFQGLFAAVQFALGATLQFLGSALSGLGSVLGSFAQGLGGFVRGIGGFISNAGRSLVQGAKSLFQSSVKELFQSFKDLNFQRIVQNLKDRILGRSPLPPHAGIEIGRPLPDGVRLFSQQSGDSWAKYFQAPKSLPRNSNPLQAQIEKVVTDALVTIITGGKVDKQGEKGKIGSLVESLVGTVVHAGVEALKDRFLKGFSPGSLPSSPAIEAAGVRGPPILAPFVEAGSRIVSPLAGNQPLFRSLQDYKLGSYVFAYNGNGNPYQYQSSKSPYPQKLERLSADRYRGENESGRFIEGRFNNARPNESPQIEVIDNLKTDGVSLPDRIYGRLIGRNANDLLPPSKLARRTGIPVDLTPEEVAKIVLENSGRLPGRQGWVFQGKDFDDYQRLLPKEIQDRAGSLRRYFEDQEFIFFGDTTRAAEFYKTQLSDPNLNALQRFAKGEILAKGFHNTIERKWFGLEQTLIAGQPGTGLAQYRVGEVHLTDLYVDRQQGFVMWHTKESPNARAGGLVNHLVSDLPNYFVKKFRDLINRLFGRRETQL